MKPLHIPKDKRWKSLKVYCGHNSCRTTIDRGICKVTGKKIESCPHGDKHRFKVFAHIPGTRNSRRTKMLDTRDIDEAIKQTIDFNKQVKDEARQVPSEIIKDNTNQMVFLNHAYATYLATLNGKGVPEHLKRVRSKEHVQDVFRIGKAMFECFDQLGRNRDEVRVTELNDYFVGELHEYLLKVKGFGNRTYSKYMTNLKGFMNWYSLETDIPIKNPFAKVKKRPDNPQPKAISKHEFEKLLEKITYENGIVHYPNGIRYKRGNKLAIKWDRNFYWKHLKFAFKLDLHTGLRREELISLKNSNIKEFEGMKFIQIENFKVNKIQNRNDQNDKKYVFVPVTEALLKILKEGGYSENADPEEYILAPEVTDKALRTKSMSDTLSRGFNHFYKLVNPDGNLTFRSLRKAYITSMSYFTGGDPKSITQHHDNDILEKYYVDKLAMLKVAKNFEPFIPEIERKGELENLREEAKDKLDLNRKGKER